MGGIGFRSFTFMVFIAFLLWSSGLETCIARRSRHWSECRAHSCSLSKKKGKSHGGHSSHHHHHHHHHNHHHHSKGSKPKPPSHKAPPHSPTPAPPEEHVPSPPEKASDIFNVLHFGAKGNGKADDTKAFKNAWAAACKVRASMMLIPEGYVFLVGPISFLGPHCQANIVFRLDGTIVAPTKSNAWGKGLLQWIEFKKLVGISIKGKGTIDGSGSVWWQDEPFADPVDDETKFIIPLNDTVEERPPMPIRDGRRHRMPRIKPTALRFYGSFNVSVTGIAIQNSPRCHLKFDNCMGVVVHDISVSSPGDSPNTDGIHLQNSKDVLIHSSNLACGDDCVSIQTGCTNVYIHNVNCGPGHGISIGSLGKHNTKACVSNITVRDVKMHKTMTGVRIKTWQGGSGSVEGVLFSNIRVSEVKLPIIINQYYCDKNKCKNQTSAVSVTGINYERIRGTYTVKPVHFACSDTMPCMDISLTNIELSPLQESYHMYDPFCWQTFGELKTPITPPIECLQTGKPSSGRPQTEKHIC